MLNVIHRSLAGLILVFVLIHIANHLTGIVSVDEHMKFMALARKFYRHAYVEPMLLMALAFQMTIGLYFVYRSWGVRRGFFQRAQALSGCYLVFFLVVHIGATLNARETLNLDTNFYFAAAGMHVGNLAYYFVPYYFLAVVAVFVHMASAIHWSLSGKYRVGTANAVGFLIILMGVVTALLIIASLSGLITEVRIPAEYQAMFGDG